jgi:hypothetical protein
MFDKTIENSQSHLSEMKNKLNDHAASLQALLTTKVVECASSFQQISYDVINKIQRAAPKHNSTPTNINNKTTVESAAADIRSPTAEPSHTPPADVNPITRLAHQPSPTAATTVTDPKPFKAASRWSNVDPVFIHKIENLTPSKYADNNAAPDNQGPPYNGGTQLPPVLYDMDMKRTSVQYAGQSNILVFYNQFMNGVTPYGIFLKKIIDIKVDETLCPDFWEGIEISNNQYLQMASCLYAKLSSVNVIPLEFQYARNIINRFAEVNDGYKALYNMLEPMLQRDTISTLPTMVTCSDVHEYALKIQSYFHCETLAGRLYRQRKQTNLFLEGLETDPQYCPAVKRAGNLLDTGNPKDPTVPPALRPTAIPNTIKRYMKEETGRPIIRAAINNGNKWKTSPETRNYSRQQYATSDKCTNDNSQLD